MSATNKTPLVPDRQPNDVSIPLEEVTSDQTVETDVPQPPPIIGNPKEIFLHQWRDLLAELWGTMLFVYLGTGSVVASIPIDGTMDSSCVLAISLGFGFGLCTMVYATANISGGHLNPAVTLAIVATRKMPLLKGLAFIVCQCVGAILGSALIYGSVPNEVSSKVNYGATIPAINSSYGSSIESGFTFSIEPAQAFMIEVCLTFLLVFTIFATAGISHDKRYMGRFAPLSVGFAVMVGHLVGAPFTGPSMNPARSFGPAIISGVWDHHYIYWVGPITGGVLAGLVYKYVFISAEDAKKLEMS
eukprot:TRINITY_DN3419_c1_g4_i1.p1 TRINITY_DN3419_c1_g4~~TRINITY_DN3419_c1_g4_i1.p1  ORF type:complete len:302 (+),score=60.20 TRINITY_DN3419_c1_g4_i1:23-928(+)